VCGTSFCFACKASPPHEPATCAAWERLRGEHSSVARRGERESEAWIQVVRDYMYVCVCVCVCVCVYIQNVFSLTIECVLSYSTDLGVVANSMP